MCTYFIITININIQKHKFIKQSIKSLPIYVTELGILIEGSEVQPEHKDADRWTTEVGIDNDCSLRH